jgi:two-component system, OmpR family, phosphate regulon response regulator PhoB
MSVQIMIVDDDPALRTLISIMLKRAGFRSIESEDGEHALTLLESCTPDLFILDVMMPGINGIELCRQIRKRPDTVDSPVLILSARQDAALLHEAYSLGVKECIQKPVLFNDLVTAVTAALPPTAPGSYLRASSQPGGTYQQN